VRPLIVSFLVLVLFSAGPAHAYLDPNATSAIMQILAPVVIAVGALWGRIKVGLSVLRHRVFGTRKPPSDG
jgi:hypothetical protein